MKRRAKKAKTSRDDERHTTILIDGTESCPICLLEKSEVTYLHDGKHAVCSECFEETKRNCRNCPLCRTPLALGQPDVRDADDRDEDPEPDIRDAVHSHRLEEWNPTERGANISRSEIRTFRSTSDGKELPIRWFLHGAVEAVRVRVHYSEGT